MRRNHRLIPLDDRTFTSTGERARRTSEPVGWQESNRPFVKAVADGPSHNSYHGLAALAHCRPGRQPPPQALGPSPRPEHLHQGAVARDGRDRRGGQVSGHVVTQDRLRRDLPSRTPRLERGPGLGVEPDAQHHLLRHPSRPLSTRGVNMLGQRLDAVSTRPTAAVPRRRLNGWFVRRRPPAARAGVRS